MSQTSKQESPRFLARMAGLFWGGTFLAGMLALVLGGGFVVAGDPAATAAKILAGEPVFRAVVAANLIATACYVGAVLFIYALLAAVHRTFSLLAGFFGLVGCALGAMSGIFQLAPLVLLNAGQAVAAIPTEQLHAWLYLYRRLNDQASTIGFLFFGLHCLLVGLLILRSTFMPRFLGVLMLLAGAGWLTFCFASVLSPPFAGLLFPYILLPGMIGEGTLTVWLLAKAVDAPRWREQASGALT
jgi:hypothetical protein